jgi:hypothetical protein
VRLDGLHPHAQPHDNRLGGVALGDLRQARRTDRSEGIPRIGTADGEASLGLHQPGSGNASTLSRPEDWNFNREATQGVAAPWPRLAP